MVQWIKGNVSSKGESVVGRGRGQDLEEMKDHTNNKASTGSDGGAAMSKGKGPEEMV